MHLFYLHPTYYFMKIVFMGSARFSVPALEAILRSAHLLTGVITNPEEPAGRGLNVRQTPVAEIAKTQGIDLLTPGTLKNNRDVIDWIKAYKPDAIAVVAYGKFIPSAILNIPVHGCLNLHPSLLPKYRGAAPIQRAIMNNEKETGVTVMRLDEGMDSGPVFIQEKVGIDTTDNAATLGEKLSKLGADLLIRTLDLIEQKHISPLAQKHGLATLAPKISKEEGRLDFLKPALLLNNIVRALIEWPTAWTTWKNNPVQVLSTGYTAGANTDPPGTIVAIDRVGVHVATGDGTLIITAVRPAGGRSMDALSYANGRRIMIGDTLG